MTNYTARQAALLAQKVVDVLGETAAEYFYMLAVNHLERLHPSKRKKCLSDFAGNLILLSHRTHVKWIADPHPKKKKEAQK